MSPRLRRLLGWGLAAVALGFLGYTIAAHWAELRAHDWEADWDRLLISLVALVLVLAWGVWVLALVIGALHDRPVRFRDLLRIWFLSSLARYVPGKIWQFVGAAQMAPSAGIPGPVLLTAMVLHIGFSLLAAAVVSLTLLFPGGFDVGFGTAAGVGALAALSLVLVHPRVLNACLRLVPQTLHEEVLRWDGRWRDGLTILALSILSWIAYGAAFSLFVGSVVDVPAAVAVPLTGANALAFLVGYFVFLAPAGMGAREAALAVLLRPYTAVGVAAVVALAARLWTIAAEVLGAALVTALTPSDQESDRRGGTEEPDGGNAEAPETPLNRPDAPPRSGA